MEEHKQARYIVETINKNGFLAYYAGGWVRDLLLQQISDDIDIATNAPPETIQALFPHTVPIGIAFGIILVIVDGHQYEVATFRQDSDYHDGRRPQKVEFCDPKEDAKRRDFTINGMFFDPIHNQVIDYVEGKADLEKKLIRAIGNPHERIKEDRLRMIRAIRLQCKLNFTIEDKTLKAICDHARELFPSVAIERVWNEFTKAHAFGKLPQMLLELHKTGLLQTIFKALENIDLQTIEKRLEPTLKYPKETLEIAFILPLFAHKNVLDDEVLCKYLKLSVKEIDFVKFLFIFKKSSFEETVTDYIWAHLYANKWAPMAINITACYEPKILKQHQARQKSLEKQILRIQNKNPVVTSLDLKNLGISPGVLMGSILKEAEKIAIEEKLEDPLIVLQKLRNSPLWPK